MAAVTGDRPLVTLVTASDRPGAAANNESRWLRAAFVDLGVRCDAVYLEGPPGIEHMGSVRRVRLGTLRARSSIRSLARYLRDSNPALTIAWPSHIGPFAVIAGVLARRPVVPWEVTLLSLDLGDHSDWPRSQRVVPLLQKLTYPVAPRVAANSADVAAEVAGRVRVRGIAMLPNPVDVDGVRAAGRAPLRLPRFRFCAVGRLAFQKGYDVMLDAFARADARLPGDWELVILGDGPRRPDLVEQVRRLGLERHVSLLGHDENPYPIIAGADVFVHAARWEGFGIVLTEALALERPIIATACPGGPREILADGRGLLVPSGDAEELADGLARIAHDDGLRAELASRALEGAQRYSAHVVARQMCELAAELTP